MINNPQNLWIFSFLVEKVVENFLQQNVSKKVEIIETKKLSIYNENIRR